MFNIFTKNTAFWAKTQDASDEYQRGSAIIWIFLMIAIFAALNYAVSKGSRGNEGQLTKEQARVAATEILDYARAIRDTVRTLQINGCSDTDISFENGIVSGYEHTPSARDECKVFHPDGGGMNYIRPDNDWLANDLSAAILALDHYGTWYTNSRSWISGLGVDGATSECKGGAADGSCRELLTGIPFIKHEICLEINKKIGWSTGSAAQEIYVDNGASYGASPSAPFNGTYGNGHNQGVSSPGNYSNIMLGCIQGDTNPADAYSFFQVLIAR